MGPLSLGTPRAFPAACSDIYGHRDLRPGCSEAEPRVPRGWKVEWPRGQKLRGRKEAAHAGAGFGFDGGCGSQARDTMDKGQDGL